MPRMKYSLCFKGLFTNNVDTSAPEGSLLRALNLASLAGSGMLRSGAPSQALSGTGPTMGKSRVKFNSRFLTRGSPGGGEKIERETAVAGGTYATIFTSPTLTSPVTTLQASSAPDRWVMAQPTPEKDEHLFMVDPANDSGKNALLKINDAGTVSHWGILPPAATDVTGITVALNAQQSKYINFVAADPLAGVGSWTLATADEDAIGAATAISSVATPAVDGNSIKFIIDKSDSAQMTNILGANVDLTTFGAQPSSDEDFIQFWVRVRRPSRVQSLEIAFDTTVAGDFKKDFFSREVTFKLVTRAQKKKLVGLGDLVPINGVQDFLDKQSAKLYDLTFQDDIGKQQIGVAKNTWSRVTLPKNSFAQSGSPDWSTVRAIRFTLHATAEGKTAVFLDALTLNGGAGMYGDYKYTITYSSEDGTPQSPGSRSNPAIDDDKGTATGLRNSLVFISMPGVERQSVKLTFPALAFDPQVTRLEIWRTVGNGDAYFRCGYITVSGGALGAGATFDDSAADYYGLNAGALATTSGNNRYFAVLDPSVELPFDNTSPNDVSFAFRTAADRPHLGRMWWTGNVVAAKEDGTVSSSLGTRGLIYYSPIGRMESVQGWIYITSGVSDQCVQLVVWNDRLFVFTYSSVYEIVGTGEPFQAQKIEGAPGTIYPYTIAPSNIGLLWVSVDGVYKFNGQFAENITDPVLMPVFRHAQSVGDLTVSINSNVRAVAGRNAYYIGKGYTNYCMVYDFDTGVWRYLDETTTPSANNGAITYDPSTGKVFVDGNLSNRELEPLIYPSSGTYTTTVEPLPYVRSGPGRKGILRKIWIDVTRGTGGAATSVAPSVIIDDVVTALATFTIPSTNVHTVQEYNLNYPGEVFGMRLTLNGARDVRINTMEMDVYIPGAADEE